MVLRLKLPEELTAQECDTTKADLKTNAGNQINYVIVKQILK